jgi:hypothetical protein
MKFRQVPPIRESIISALSSAQWQKKIDILKKIDFCQIKSDHNDLFDSNDWKFIAFHIGQVQKKEGIKEEMNEFCN